MTDTLDEKILLKNRGSQKSKVTNFSNFVNKLKSKDTLTEKDLTELTDRLSQIESIYCKYDEIQTNLESVTANVDAQYKERDEFEQRYYDVISDAKCLLKENHNSEKVSDDESNYSNKSANMQSSKLVKLPDIKLPSFAGSYNHWLEYRDTFQSLIHDSDDITQIQKFHYLRASLEGAAAQVIKSFEFSAENYNAAWNLLCKRYNNKYVLIHNHLDALFNIEKIQKASSSKIHNLIDDVWKHLRSLESLGQKVEFWDMLVIHLITKKLDDVSLTKWEEFKLHKESVTLDNMYDCLRQRAELLERLEVNKNAFDKSKDQHNTKSKSFLVSNHASSKNTDVRCKICNDSHAIFNCKKFIEMEVKNRTEKAKELKLCLNCLRSGHFVKRCYLRGGCKKCNRRHNTLLHFEGVESNQVAENVNNNIALTAAQSTELQKYVVLPTVLVNVYDENQVAYPVRALLDSGSQSSFITESLCRRLKLKLENINFSVSGLNNSICHLKYKTNVRIWPKNNKFSINLCCLVLPKVTGVLPAVELDFTRSDFPQNIDLADPTFDKSGPVDMLIGSDIFWTILNEGQINLGKNKPILQNTKFGWVVSGQVFNIALNQTLCNFSQGIVNDVDSQLESFFKLEEVPSKKPWSPEEIKCEEHFVQNTKRLPNGRFEVLIPLKDSEENLGDSHDQAKKRFLSLERKFETNSNLKAQYCKFLKEYLDLGHMTLVTADILDNTSASYYCPHHGTCRSSSLTTKLRVVFDASACTTSGKSFNDLQMVGPTIQDDLFSILLRFRQHSIVFTADIEKMYRQVSVAKQQRDLQRILWRENPQETLNIFRLNTVTYGTASAPFLAIRCLEQLAQECHENLPDISNIISHDFYVDDLLSGCSNIDEAKYICDNIMKVLHSGCFNLRKWRSNCPELLSHLNTDSNVEMHILNSMENDSPKTLGLMWSSQNDSLLFNINYDVKSTTVTKRVMLSCIAKIFDPLGLLSPCVIIAKTMLQRLWLEKLTWDDPVSLTLNSQWFKFVQQLSALNDLKIQRHVVCQNPEHIELHCFSDASETAYGGCIYVRSVDRDGKIHCNLLCSKSKVAPIKPTTIPRLELCAAHITAKLADKVTSSLRLRIQNKCFWSDSKVVIGWINTSANLLKPFVRNRVVEIQDLTGPQNWRYVPTNKNPADLLSRGLYPNLIQESDIWWHGPTWLSMNHEEWPENEINHKLDNLPDLKMTNQVALASTISTTEFPFERFSNLSRLKRSCAYMFRFKTNCMTKREFRTTAPLSVEEVNGAFLTLIKIAQQTSFSEEFKNLSQGKPLHRKSKLLNLNPYLDESGIMRVGGRLSNSNFDYDKKHPMLLSTKHHLTKLIFQAEHEALFHAGPQHLLSSIRERFWPIAGKSFAKLIVRQCVRCFRHKAKCIQPIMGNLPETRFCSGFPFQVTGLDYAGPFLVKDKRGRGCKLVKGYICLFICFATKAIHLELVTDLSTHTFLLAFKRFIARRGKPLHLYSDNGKTFIGANRELKELGKFLHAEQSNLADAFQTQNIVWHFIPAYAPTFGGLWEAGVKSTKYHLKRVLGNSHLTYEEFSTLLTQIEAILNSRPITPLSSDPSDPTPLTPAHFLIGRPLTAPCEQDIQSIPEARLSRYQRLEQLRQHFWTRWKKDYVGELQQRTKWKTSSGSLKEGTLVILKDDNTSPMQWKLGRITELFPGKDNVSRVANVKTASGLTKRAFTKLCPLPEVQ